MVSFPYAEATCCIYVIHLKMATSELKSVSPVLSNVSTSHATVVGRPLKSAVWKFFEYNAWTKKSID